MAYFQIATGLRGCYMPNSTWIVRCRTRRELRAVVEDEARRSLDAYGYGDSKRARRAVIAQIWRETRSSARRAVYPYVIGFGCSRDKTDRPYGVFISHATRREFLEFQREE